MKENEAPAMGGLSGRRVASSAVEKRSEHQVVRMTDPGARISRHTIMRIDVDMFDWEEFPEGRACFSGNARGVDETGHETIAVEYAARTYYGEVRCAYLPGRYDFNIEVFGFGHLDRRLVGMPMNPESPSIGRFERDDLDTIRNIIAGLVQRCADASMLPATIAETARSRFMGELHFADGWAQPDPGPKIRRD